MIRMLVVEDENVIRDGLMKHVPWQELGIGEVRQAANAEEALAVCREYVPDVISSDIRMPGLSGVELCTKLREQFPDVTILFVTGYSDKEYLKAAINLHVIRYVEKPIQMAEYTDAIREAIRQVRLIRERKASQFRTLTFGTEGAAPLSVKHNHVAILHLEEPEKSAEVRTALTEQMLPLQKKYELSFLTELRDSENLMLLIGRKQVSSYAQKEAIFQQINRCISQCTQGQSRWFLSFGSEVRGAEEIRQSWDQAFRGLQALAYLGWNHSVWPADWEMEAHEAAIPTDLMDAFTEMTVTEKPEGQRACLEELYQFLVEQKVFLRSDIRFLYLSWYRMLLRSRRFKFLAGSAQEGISEETQLFEKAQTFQEMHDCLLGLLEKAAGNPDSTEGNSASYVVQKARDYIGEHCADRELSIKVLAEYVGLTPTYLSSLFKKETGVTVGQYLMDVRIGRAKHLMKDPQKKIYEIADLVGYEDVDYFARVFKRATGMTPSEYRRKQL